MTNVLMDHQTFDMQKFGGISRYFTNIHHYLQEDPEYRSEISLLKTNNFYLRNDIFSKNPFTGYLLKRTSKQFRFNRKYSIQKISQNKFDIFHPTYYDPYFLDYVKKPFVLTVHDMIHEIYPEFFAPYDQFSKFKRLTINRADHIIAISESTKNDMQKFFDIPDEKISVIYHGINTDIKPKLPPLSTIDSPYILYIGDRAGYKNFFRFLYAFKEAGIIYKDLKLICTGTAFNSVESEFLMRNNLSDKIMQIAASDENLDALYQHALCYVSPSLLEGFGFPILEAYANRCLTLLSDISCFREIAGEGAIYFDPFSIDDMAKKLLLAVEDTSIREHKITLGNKQLLKFSLEKSMQGTKEVYTKFMR